MRKVKACFAACAERGCSVPRLIMMTVLWFAALGPAARQEKTSANPATNLTKETAGREIFLKYCASCHGTSARGDGPAAFTMKTSPPDLTTLSKRHDGKYPAGYVSAVLKFGRSLASHGSEDMPVWGTQFKNLDPLHDPTGQQHVDNLVAFIKSLQTK